MNIILENEQLLVEVSQFAGHIERLFNKKSGKEHYWAYDSKEWPRRTSVCFPVCGRFASDAYVYGGTRYNMAMHGFLRERLLKIVSRSKTGVTFYLESDEATKENYPFDFQLFITYRLKENALHAEYTVKNTGTGEMPFSTGSHYTYRVPVSDDEAFDEYEFVFAKVQTAGRFLIENKQIVGKSDDFFKGRDRIPLKGLFGNGSVTLDCSELTDARVSLQNRRTGSGTAVRFDGFRYCVLWAPRDQSPFVCIEPWTGIAHSNQTDERITEKMGMILLKPDERRIFCQTILCVGEDTSI